MPVRTTPRDPSGRWSGGSTLGLGDMYIIIIINIIIIIINIIVIIIIITIFIIINSNNIIGAGSKF